MDGKRIAYIDNLRWICVWSVVVFHVIDVFTSTGVPIHYNAQGIAALDGIGYFFYPWFMALLFILAGMSAKEALKTKSTGEFIKARTKKLLVPFLAYEILFAVPTAALCFTWSNGWQDFAGVPKGALVVVMLCVGMGHAWFLLQLYLVSLLFLPIQKAERKIRVTAEKTNVWVLLLFAIPLYFSAQILNVIEVFRNLFYYLLFLLGYFVLSVERVQETLEKYKWILLAAALLLFPFSYAASAHGGFAVSAKKLLSVLYGYIMCLALIGVGRAKLSFQNKITRYLSKTSFSVYLFHYLPMLLIAHFTVETLHASLVMRYVITLALTVAAVLAVSKIVPYIPIINRLFCAKKI